MMHERASAGLRRALVVTVGATAAAVAGQTLALGRAWLGVEPPLALAALPAAALSDPLDAATRGDLVAALDRLAEARLAAQLQQAGVMLARPSEITVWLVIQADDAPGAGAVVPPALTLPAAVGELAWERLRAQAPTHALLLTEPAAEALGAAWAAALAAAGVEGIGLVSPVSADRLRWAAADWQANAAVSLALWLWSDMTLGAAVAEHAPAGDGATGARCGGLHAPVAVWAMGAAAWQAPRAEMRAALILRGAQAAAARLLGGATDAADDAGLPPWELVSCQSSVGSCQDAADDAGLPPWELPGLAVAPERHRLSLAAAVPPQPIPLTWGRRQPAWAALATLPEALRQQAAAQARHAQEAQFNPRGAWLAGQVAAWAAALDQLAAARLGCAGGWGDLPGLQTELRAKLTQLRAACALIEEWLEEAGGRFARAEDDVARAERELTALCASFPAPGRAGALALLVRPWRWPALAWAYGAQLPQTGQRYLDACSRRGEARWAEANLHALRQAYLAMAQILQERQPVVDARIADLRAARDALAQALAELPAPWTAARLAALGTALAAGPGPGWGWATGAAATAKQALLDWAAARVALVDGWTAADWLAAALDDGRLAAALAGEWAERATPLWPGVTPGAETVSWLVCGGGAAGKVAGGWQPQHPWQGQSGPTGAARLAAALRRGRDPALSAAGDGELRCGACQADVVALVRLMKVSLADQEGI